jgi:hypothetical protein
VSSAYSTGCIQAPDKIVILNGRDFFDLFVFSAY